MSRQIIFYGAVEYATKILGDKPILKLVPPPPSLEQGVCFADADKRKHGATHLGLPIMSLETALARHELAGIYITIGNHDLFIARIVI